MEGGRKETQDWEKEEEERKAEQREKTDASQLSNIHFYPTFILLLPSSFLPLLQGTQLSL